MSNQPVLASPSVPCITWSGSWGPTAVPVPANQKSLASNVIRLLGTLSAASAMPDSSTASLPIVGTVRSATAATSSVVLHAAVSKRSPSARLASVSMSSAPSPRRCCARRLPARRPRLQLCRGLRPARGALQTPCRPRQLPQKDESRATVATLGEGRGGGGLLRKHMGYRSVTPPPRGCLPPRRSGCSSRWDPRCPCQAPPWRHGARGPDPGRFAQFAGHRGGPSYQGR
ncbi:hypothetical protein QBC39DRAFT_23005 [Podospora conica]|nr:hypothetical protein QBC39DRAFT_23005 [Schizothecium conicum]